MKPLAVRLAIWGLVLVAAACIGLLFVISRLMVWPELRVIDRKLSPDSRVEAVLLTSDSGATTRVGYHVSVVEAGAESSSGHEVFIADSLREGTVVVDWRASDLVISYPEDARLFLRGNAAELGGNLYRVVYEPASYKHRPRVIAPAKDSDPFVVIASAHYDHAAGAIAALRDAGIDVRGDDSHVTGFLVRRRDQEAAASVLRRYAEVTGSKVFVYP
jgi:hypothetical protein